jgi:hypothetical protein
MMDGLTPPIAGTLAAAVWFGVFVTVHWLGVHWLSPAGRARIMLVGYGLCCLGLVLTVVVLIGGGGGRLIGGLFALMTMSCLLVLYTPAYYVIANSLSVQSMVLVFARGGSLPRDELYATFAGRRLLHGRLATMVRSGFVVADGTRFRLTRKGRRLIAPFLIVKSVWRLGPGG